jgi:hypothetical protein
MFYSAFSMVITDEPFVSFKASGELSQINKE